jgi:hypothetical protein
MLDGGLDTSVVTLGMSAVTYAQAVGAAPAIVAAYQAISKSIIMGWHLLEKWSIDGADPADATGNKAEKAKITATVDGNPLKNVSLAIQNPIDGIFLGAPGTPGYDVVDIVDGTLLTYTDYFLAAAGTGGLTVSDGELIAALVRGRRS